MKSVAILFSIAVVVACAPASARTLVSTVSELDRIPSVHADYPVPNEPNMLFYVERSVNSNTVVYTAHVDARGQIDSSEPVDAFWRWFNVDGHKKPLNFIERMLAYGVHNVEKVGASEYSFELAALPEREIRLSEDRGGHPAAYIQMGKRAAKLVYVYLDVDNKGFMPTVNAIDVYGTDKLTGKPLREHVLVR